MTRAEMFQFCDEIHRRSLRAGHDPLDLLACLTTALVTLIATNPEPEERHNCAAAIIDCLELNFPPADATRH